MKLLDYAFLAASLALTASTAWWVLAPSDAAPHVEIQSADGAFVYPLNETRTLQVKGPLGNTEVHIEDGQVWIEDSPCTNKVCLAMGHVHRAGQFVACLPNRIFVRVAGGSQAAADDGGPDAGVW